jgi:hypothetical protein
LKSSAIKLMFVFVLPKTLQDTINVHISSNMQVYFIKAMQSHHLSHDQIIKKINYKTIIIFFSQDKSIDYNRGNRLFQVKMTIHIQETENHSQVL